MNAPQALGYAPGVSLAPQESQASPTAASFGSNNPFRNRALSPSVAGSVSSNTRPERPRSTNPFLDDSEALSPQSAPGMASGAMVSPTEKTDISSHTRELFESLSLKPAPQTNRRPSDDRTAASRTRPPRERPSERSATSKGKDPLDIFADPPSKSASTRAPPRRPRRNSESSVMDRGSKLLDVDDSEKRRRERRNREREGRSKDTKDGKSRSGRKDRRLDIIDKLDVTSIYGTGMFHHDGPFDACNPHRNRRGVRTAPMQAFPKGSTNMALGGTGPNNSNIDLNLFHGRQEEGHNDFATAARRNADSGNSFDPTARVDPIHGPQSMGLGTSTFLDGAPASRSAMARRQSENEGSLAPNGGLARKKSLAQRLRGRTTGPGRVTSPEYSTPPPALGSSHSASSRNNERNPYFQDQDYDEEWDKKGSSIEARMEGGRLRSSSSPKQATGLERKPTNDRYEESKLNPGGGGFLNRMKSLRKPKPERRTSD
ncbi:hypothetical protein N7541_001718 [Penicillium brevicompactum]|uniref:Pal1 cell morphology n=1 Tax=Penicillium brevicompactum TaxID=5074 RepID=A0A9W9RWM4_PENBR|nr:uncharacterized protein N7506_000624 [Penicillium brevicompactum]KAJ5328145.1 hypothetical protein N7452_008535 [Penicillium brevicompactum]KAJ5347371.1 hypothetical protein N7506_000624 [Penicillium brevicompactum]KAJ5367777.1 hypothetical protein N7541_001718 [Penicillium brevicompactum]